MIPGINPKQMEKVMKQMGIKQEQILAKEVVIRTETGEILIRNPSVIKVNMMGQETFQIAGEIETREGGISDEDVKLVMEQTGVSEKKAKEILEETDGDIAEAIIKLEK